MSRSDALRLIGDLFALGAAIARALETDRIERVRDILPDELRTSVAKAAADARRRLKFPDAS